ncbi:MULTISPECIES: Csu type fimbrial protein [unclassified Variovorax]|uniref:Csu type fimbrial protein n=1 Tax=unclassified Variovorax TaxID=663243 RepID=UPI000D128B86|nr:MULTISPECIES: spore coat protein U domain-containing protein [unclassified Variovorax]AVQ83461.1 spore coat protein U [Variovorax sp. PMC12]QRY32221.1 spore coat protein U domain-containing protein [Variovorax sp. PDNC026]
MKNPSFLLAAVLAISTTSAAVAATSTSTFQVLINVNKACVVIAGPTSNIDFGSVASYATGLSASNSISVTCSKSTPYNVGLLPSNNSTTGGGVMSPVVAGPDTVPYQLRSVSATGPVWGSTATATSVGNGVAGTGTGAAQTIPVWATVANANVTPGAYIDTVTVQVNY